MSPGTMSGGRSGLAIALVATLLWSAPCRAQQPLTLEAAQTRAAAGSLRPRLARQEVAAAQGALRQAQVSPNPRISVQSGWDGFTRHETAGVWLERQLELGGKRQARTDLARLRLAAAEQSQAETARALRREVRLRFVETLFEQELLAVQEDLLASAARQAEVARERRAAGRIAGSEVLQLEAEAARRAAARDEVAGRREARWAELALLLAADPARPEPLAGSLASSEPLPPLEHMQQRALAARPDLAVLATRAQEGQAAVRLEEARGVADLTVRGGVSSERLVIDSPAIDDTGTSLGLQLEMPLPISDTNQGRIEEAQAEARAAELRVELARQEVASQVTAAWRQAAAARTAADRLADEALPRAERAAAIAEEAYRMGARSLPDFLGARDTYLRVRTEALEARLREARAMTDLEAALGEPLPGGTP